MKDCSGHGHDGTVIGQASAVWTTGKFGGGFTPATTACIDLGTPAELMREGADFTVAAWAKPTTFGVGSSAFYVFGRTKEPNTAGWRLAADTGTTWAAKFADSTQGPLAVASAGGQSTDVWSHVAVTFAKGGTATIYVNGAASGSTPLSMIVPDTQATLRIGCKGDDNLRFRGALDEVRIYGRAFSAADVAALAARTP